MQHYHPRNHKPKTLKLSNLPERIEKEHLELYFEDEEIFGKSIQVKIDLHEATTSAFVHCCDVEGLSQNLCNITFSSFFMLLYVP